MKRKELLAVCEELIKSFDPAKTTVDAHATEELRGLSSTSDQRFLQQVLYGSYRYRELLRPMLTMFLDSHSSQVSRTDYTKFLIMGYLAMFRLEELGTSAFAGLALALQPTSMHTFLSYIFNQSSFEERCKTNGLIIDKMLRFKPEIDKLLSQLHTKIFGRAASTQSSDLTASDASAMSSKKLTVPVAPNITQPKPRKAVEPIRIPREVKANPVPASLNRLSLAVLQAQQEVRKERIMAEVTSKYDLSDEFQFATAGRRNNLEQYGKKLNVSFDFKAKPVPEAAASTTEVKLTAAAILREDALHKRKKEREAALIRAYELELRDPLEFYRWQANMQQQDEANYRREVETRRLEMVQAQYDAMEAARQAKLENREVAIEMKEQAQTRAAEREKEENELVEKYRSLTEEVKREFLAAERERKAQQDAKERAAREDLIRQIRALDRVHRENVAVFDPTETAQLGLLEEMSLAELRERLRQEKTADLLEKATNAARRRRATASANATARSKKKALAAAREMEEQALLEELATRRRFLGAAKNMLEENHFDQLKCGFERQAKNRQGTHQIESITMENVRIQEHRMNADYRERQRLSQRDEEQERASIYARAKEDARRRNREEDETLRALVRHEQQRFTHARGTLQARNIYKNETTAPGVSKKNPSRNQEQEHHK
ncbi:hypothetical protein GQ600_17774 [Phytophthora cactorum]|nr:hypothetical protein GQ600_17774 [Phytophthora cactorum]